MDQHDIIVTNLLRTNFVRRPLDDSRRVVPRTICASVCFALSVLAPVSRPVVSAIHADTPAAPAASEAIVAGPVRSDRPLFRLGDAAKPFGWSSVIGDFNTDGQPDVAVADHIGTRRSSYAYRLEFSVSGQAPHDVTFESSQDRITVSVADVDRDNDLDVIVRTPLTGETVGIWLNDGQGHFTAGDVRQLPTTIGPVQSVSTTDPAAHSAAFELSPRRAKDALPAAFGAARPRSARPSALPRSHTVRSAFPSTRTSPRGPPSAFPDVLS